MSSCCCHLTFIFCFEKKKKMGSMGWCCVLVVVLLLGGGGLVEGKGPELVGSSVWYTNTTLINTEFDVAVVQMDYDQPLYTNGHSFLCPESDQPCPELSCRPCDWSGQEPTGCGESDCCGPAQSGDMEKAAEWCAEGGPSYETLRIGETSRRFTLLKGETMYVRFFIPEELYCHSIVLIPRPYYGSPSWSFSTLEAFPSFSTVTGWRNGLSDQKSFGFGQTGALFCPNTTLHPEYNVGTYSGMIFGLTETSFEIEIQVSPQSYPLPEPSSRFPCSDVPDDVLEYAGQYEPAFCLDDGKSMTFTFEDTNRATSQLSLVLPVPQGCHTISFSSASEIPTSPTISHRVYCLPSQTGVPRGLSNAAMTRFSNSGQNMVLSTCFEEEVTYLICTLRLTEPEPVHFSFSTVSNTIRKNILELPDASLAYMDGLQAAFGIIFGEQKFACYDFYTNCFEYTLTPSDDTLFLFPPPSSSQLKAQETYEDLQEFYRNEGLQKKKENRLSFVILLQSGTLTNPVANLSEISLAITSITNEDGESVILPGGGVDNNPENDEFQYGCGNYLPHIPLVDIMDFQLPFCDTEKYQTYQNIVLDRLQEIEESTTLDSVLSLKYSLDVMNEGLLAQSCQNQIVSNLETYVSDVIVSDSSDCIHPFATLEYFADPCCNVFLSLVACCIPSDYNNTVQLYSEEADTSTCMEEECAQSYYEDLSFSLNNLEDVAFGCTSGIENPSNALSVSLVDSVQQQYITCLDAVGLGEFYQGITCQKNSDCAALEGECYQGKCTTAPLEQLENDFLNCYISNMPASLESYLRRNVFPSSVDGDRNSTEFFDALKLAATVLDCVNEEDPLAIQHRSRYQSQPLNQACVSTALGLGWPNEDFEEACPGEACLRSYGCLINVTSCVYKFCDGFTQNYIEATEESCPINAECNIDLEGDCEGFHCIYCPPNGERPCQEVGIYSTKEECEAAFACELPDGTLDFTLSEEECRNQGAGCSTDCLGLSCESIYNYNGGCFVPTITTDSECDLYIDNNGVEGEWYKEGVCVLSGVLTESECGMYPSSSWMTCQENEINMCNATSLEQQYLGCYVSNWRTCENQAECESSGKCTDREFYSRITSYDPPKVVNGACISSGEYVAETRPFCGNEERGELSGIGCVYDGIDTPDSCAITRPFVFLFSDFVYPATNEEECLAPVVGRRGCQLYQDAVDVLLWITDPEECACAGGVLLDRWEWIEGEWRGGVPRRLEWSEGESESLFDYTEAISFIQLAEWIKESTEEQFLYPIQSQIICESASISVPLFILSCDCATLDGGGESCYSFGNQEKEIQMGLSEVCEGQETFIKHPSAQATFGVDSVDEGCSFLDFFIIYKNFFSAPFVPPPLSFKWQNPREKGVVINENGATVGEILGDGLVLSFSEPSVIGKFDVCLRLAQGVRASYDVLDFGYSTDKLESIYPLGLERVVEDERGSQGNWYCAEVDFQSAPNEEGTIRLFPISRIENYEEEDDEYTDKTTKTLCYVLGGFYCLVGAISVFGLGLFFFNGLISLKTLLNLPNFCTFCFLILCVFRAVFMFLYPTGTFEFQPLSYFVIFEIPTFILFSILIFMIFAFKKLVYKKGFFPGNPLPILFLGWPFVWGLWVLVTIVYSEVILDSDGGDSPCEGRVEISYEEEEEATRTLSIAYQSVIAAITIFLTSIFFYYTILIYNNTKNSKRGRFKQFVIYVGGTFNVLFLTRTILFLIILGADFASSIYLFITLFITEVPPSFPFPPSSRGSANASGYASGAAYDVDD